MAYPVTSGSTTSGTVHRADGAAVTTSHRLGGGYDAPKAAAAAATTTTAGTTSTAHHARTMGSSCGTRSPIISDMDHHHDPPLSILSISTEGSSSQPKHVIYQLQLERDGHVVHHNYNHHHHNNSNNNILNHSVMEDDDDDDHHDADDTAHEQKEHSTTKNRRHTPFMEQLYENTVDGPCQTVTLCEVQHMDLFLVSSVQLRQE